MMITRLDGFLLISAADGAGRPPSPSSRHGPYKPACAAEGRDWLASSAEAAYVLAPRTLVPKGSA